MPIKIRRKKLANGYVSVYLDIHHAGRRFSKFLGIKFKEKPQNLDEKIEKKDMTLLANKIASKYQLDGLYDEFEIDQPNDKQLDFFEYAQNFMEKYNNLTDLRGYGAVIRKLKEFWGKDRLSFQDLNEALLQRFSQQLYHHHEGETGYGYFKKLKRIIKEAVREKIIKYDPSISVKCRKKRGIEKDVLTFEDMRLLSTARCGNANVKRAFLFCCLTGLRWCDVNSLKWKNVKGQLIDLVQKKTQEQVLVSLNKDGERLLGERGAPNDLIFRLPSHTGCLHSLRLWVKKAGIEKHITWHCSRHSFGTNLVQQGTDVITASKLLGHSSIKSTTRYVRISDVLKSDAVNKFPEIL